MEDPDPSVQDWRNHLLNSLKGTGRLDTLKSQLRARLVDQLRDHDGTLLEFKGNRKPSVTERILTSLFLDYLKAYGFSFTQSVFLPESQAGSWSAFTFQEMSQLLHLDSTKSFHQCLKIGSREKGCLAQQLVMVLQQMPFRPGTQHSSTQTSRQGPQDLDGCLREIDDSCFQNKAAESRMTFRTLEERLNTFRQEFETRVNSEVALQVSRIREYESSTVRLEEEGRYRRQLAREREELEQVHKTRLERIREREESLMEQLVMKEKAIETSAYEQRQKLLASISDLRDREDRVKDKEDQQRKHDALEERDRILRMQEADIDQRGATIHAQAGIDAQVKIKDMEEKYRICQEQLQSERNLLEVEKAAHREDKERLGNELAAAKSDRDLVHSLNERLASDEKQRMELVKTLLERLTSDEEQRKLSLKKMEDVHVHTAPTVESSTKSSDLDTRYLLQKDRSENTNDLWADRSLGDGCKNCQQQHRRWARDKKKIQGTIKQLEKAVQEAEDQKEKAHQARRAIQLQLKSSDSELLETVTLLKKTQHALELERLHHYSLRSQIASVFPMSSQDKFRHQGTITSLDSAYVLTNEAHLKSCGSVLAMKDSGTKKCEEDQNEQLCHNQVISGQLPSHNATPCTNKTNRKLRDPSPVERPSSTTTYQVDTAVICHKEKTVSSSSSASETHSSFTQKQKAVIDSKQINVPNQLDDWADGFRIKDFPFRQGRMELASGSESSGCTSGINRKQTSEKQIGNTTGRPHQDEPAKSSCHQNSPVIDSPASPETSEVLVQISPLPSAQEVGLEAKSTASADFQETSQTRTNNFVVGTHSTGGDSSKLDILVNGKTMMDSSYLDDNPREDRVQINIDIIEKNFQKKVQSTRSRGIEGCRSGQQNVSSSTHASCQENFDEVSEVHTSKLIIRKGSRGQNNDVPACSESEDVDLDSVDKQKYILAHRNKLQELHPKSSELEKKRPPGDEALYKLSCQSNQDEVRRRTLDNQQHIPVHCIANDEDTVQEKEVPTHIEMKNRLSSPANSPEKVNKESCASELSKPAYPTGNSKCSLREWLTDKICMDLDFHEDQAKPSEHVNNQQQIEATLHASEALPLDNELRKSTSRQSLDSEGIQSVTQQQQFSNVSINQVQEAQSKQKELSSSTSQNSDSEPIDSLNKTEILGGASSEESSCNPTKRISSVKNTQEDSKSTRMALEAIPYWTDSQQDQGQNGDGHSSGNAGVQSEQGSYSPSEGNIRWIDDFPAAANPNYLDNSDAFSVPESDICPSGNQSSKDTCPSLQALSPESD